MATKHTLSASAWTDIGPLPLAIKQDTTDAVEIDYSATDPGVNGVGVPIGHTQLETCGPIGLGDSRHVWARAISGAAVIYVIEGAE